LERTANGFRELSFCSPRLSRLCPSLIEEIVLGLIQKIFSRGILLAMRFERGYKTLLQGGERIFKCGYASEKNHGLLLFKHVAEDIEHIVKRGTFFARYAGLFCLHIHKYSKKIRPLNRFQNGNGETGFRQVSIKCEYPFCEKLSQFQNQSRFETGSPIGFSRHAHFLLRLRVSFHHQYHQTHE
jgi:hypothetical protein